MSSSGPIIAQDLVNFGQGIYLLIGILVFLLFAGMVGLVVYVALRVWIFQLKQRRSQGAYLKRTRRADGKTYPPQGFGICEQCGHIRKVVYFLTNGKKLCHDCYEAWWPIEEGTTAKASTPAPTADHAAAEPRNPPARSDDHGLRPA